jgi:hypothetical protein
MTAVGVDAMASEQLVADVIKDARRRQRRRRLTAALLTCAGIALVSVVFPSGRTPSGQPGGMGSASAPISGGRVAGSAGVSVRLPPGWVAKSMVLPQGGEKGLAWLQATNFATGHLVRGEDPLKAMSAGQVAITITDWTPEIAHVRSPSGSRLSVSRAIPLPAAQTPRGHVVLELTPTIQGRALVIDIDFGSRGTKARMGPTVDRVLQTLSIRSLPSGEAPLSRP